VCVANGGVSTTHHCKGSLIIPGRPASKDSSAYLVMTRGSGIRVCLRELGETRVCMHAGKRDHVAWTTTTTTTTLNDVDDDIVTYH
jgi:hypothetical protein